MKYASRFLSLAFACAFAVTSFCMNPVTALADEPQTQETVTTSDKGYTYTVKLHLGGVQGAHFADNAGDTLVIKNLHYGDRVTLDASQLVDITPEEGETQYYVKGIRLAGANDLQSASAFTVTKDVDYVVAYGVGATIPVTVKYVDTNGTALQPEETFYAKEGEELYVSYKYVDGYLPDAYNKHTSSLEAGTTFTFTYTKGAHSINGGTVNDGTSYSYEYVNGQATTTYDYVEGQATSTPGVTVTSNTGNRGNGGNSSDAESADASADGQDQTETEDQEPADGPVEIEEIDDTQTPLNNGVLDSDKTPVYATIAIAILGLLALILIFFRFKSAQSQNK